MGVNERRPFGFNAAAIETDCADLYDGVFLRVETSGFEIDAYDGRHGKIIPFTSGKSVNQSIR